MISAFVVGFQVVHVRARAVHLFADGVSGAMDEVLAESLVLNVGAGGVIDFETVQDLAARDGGLDALDGAIAGVAHHFEDILRERWAAMRRNSRSR